MEKKKYINNEHGNIQKVHAIKYSGCDSFIGKLKRFLSICWSKVGSN